MKCKKFALQVLLFSLAFFYFACTNAIEDINSSGENTEVSRSVSTSSASISDFYWGYWIRLDTGDSYFISDSAIYCEGVLFSKNASSLSKYGDDSFAKMTISDSSAVLVRKYKQIAPFSLEVRSLQSGEILNQVEIVRTNEEIPSDSETAIKDSDGAFCFKTAISACKQKLNLTYTNNSGKKTEFSLNVVSPIYESKLGVIYISEDSELPSFKLISDFDLEAEPFYANDFQSYKAKFSILNFGADVDSAFSWEINSTDFLLHLEGDSSGTFSSIKQGDSIELDLSISYGFLEKEFVDVPISLTIYSQSENNLKWSDSVTVRFYRAPVYFMVNAETFASETALYGTLTAPSGFTSHFYIPSYSKNSTQVLAPWNNSGNSYILALCSSGNSGRFYSFVAGDTELSANYLEDWQSFFQNAIDELLEYFKENKEIFGNKQLLLELCLFLINTISKTKYNCDDSNGEITDSFYTVTEFIEQNILESDNTLFSIFFEDLTNPKNEYDLELDKLQEIACQFAQTDMDKQKIKKYLKNLIETSDYPKHYIEVFERFFKG